MSAELFGDYPFLSYRNISMNATGALVKAGLGCVYSYFLYNSGAVVVYIKLYDKLTLPDETDTPILTFPLGPLQGANVTTPFGYLFLNGIGIRCTTGVADNDTNSPVASTVVANLGYR
jgi:hypothetical protein